MQITNCRQELRIKTRYRITHAIHHATRLAPTMNADQIIVVNLSGRGDKDVDEVIRMLGK